MQACIPSIQGTGLLWLPQAGELLVVSDKEFDHAALMRVQQFPSVAAASAYSLHHQAAFINFHEGATPAALGQVCRFFQQLS
jgi:hypothetical protein